MPVLHEYSDSYHKSGYYVKVNWSAPHPYPLQTPGITEQIYLELGFEPEDEVPNELTSRLFNAGLHWTEGNGTGDPQKQTDLDPISDTNLPSLNSDQLQRISEILDQVEEDSRIESLDSDSLDDLRTELRKLNGDGGQKPGPMPEKTVPAVQDLMGEKVGKESVSELRGLSDFPGAFDQSVFQFSRKHLITPRDFEVNEHGSPAYTFQSGPVEWKLSDCRPDRLDFDWAVEIRSEKDENFGVRLSDDGLEYTVQEGKKLSDQQTANLITVIPCLLWTLNQLNDYSIANTWSVSGVQSSLTNSWYQMLRDQVVGVWKARANRPDEKKGVVIDLPDRQFARIRTIDRHIIYTPVGGLPDTVERGTEVSFEIMKRNGTFYAKNIMKMDDSFDPKGIPITIEENGSAHSFYIEDPVQMGESESFQLAEDIFEAVRPSIALNYEEIQHFMLNLQTENEELRQGLLECLLRETPFNPDEFQRFLEEITNHHLIPAEEVSIRVIPTAVCIAVFYDVIDPVEKLEKLDDGSDITVLYKRNGDGLIVGDELINHGIRDELSAIPELIKKSVVENRSFSTRPIIRLLAALSERQFHSDYGGTHISSVFRHGLREIGLYVIYVQTDQ